MNGDLEEEGSLFLFTLRLVSWSLASLGSPLAVACRGGCNLAGPGTARRAEAGLGSVCPSWEGLAGLNFMERKAAPRVMVHDPHSLPEAQQRSLAYMLEPLLLTCFGEYGYTLGGMDAVGSGAVLREAIGGHVRVA